MTDTINLGWLTDSDSIYFMSNKLVIKNRDNKKSYLEDCKDTTGNDDFIELIEFGKNETFIAASENKRYISNIRTKDINTLSTKIKGMSISFNYIIIKNTQIRTDIILGLKQDNTEIYRDIIWEKGDTYLDDTFTLDKTIDFDSIIHLLDNTKDLKINIYSRQKITENFDDNNLNIKLFNPEDYKTGGVIIKASGDGTGSSGNFKSTPKYHFLYTGDNTRSIKTIDLKQQILNSKRMNINIEWIAGNNNNGGENPDENEDLVLYIRKNNITDTYIYTEIIHSGNNLYNGNEFSKLNINIDIEKYRSEVDSAKIVNIYIEQLTSSGGNYDNYAIQKFEIEFENVVNGNDFGMENVRLDIFEESTTEVLFNNLPTQESGDGLSVGQLYKNNEGFLKIA